MYGVSGRAVQISSSNQVVLSANDQGATPFLLVGCREWATLVEALRSQCYSLVDANHQDRYVRHYGYFLRVDPESSPLNAPVFDLDSSFILHADTFYPGYYALESVNYPNHYIQSQDDGRLKIAPQQDTVAYRDTASFKF